MAGPWRSANDLISEARRGDLIEFDRGVYAHWGVHVGDGGIVHVPAESKNDKSATISRARLTTVAGSDRCRISNCHDEYEKDHHSGEESARRAERRLGEEWPYDFKAHNCEHFACWCRYGFEYSDQSGNDHELPRHRQHLRGKTGKPCRLCIQENKGDDESCLIL